MGRKNKLKRFAEMATFTNVIEPDEKLPLPDNHPLKGQWQKEHFGNTHPIILELGCGKGEYTHALAQKYPGINFIGVDIKGARMWVGAKKALEEKLGNAAFLRTRIEFIEKYFAKEEVSEIWITFPDPQQKKGREKKRLTHPDFLQRYQKMLPEKGIIHLKTDSQFLHEYTLEVIEEHGHELLFATNDLYGKGIQTLTPEEQDILQVKTYYEGKFLEQGLPITYLKFRLKP